MACSQNTFSLKSYPYPGPMRHPRFIVYLKSFPSSSPTSDANVPDSFAYTTFTSNRRCVKEIGRWKVRMEQDLQESLHYLIALKVNIKYNVRGLYNEDCHGTVCQVNLQSRGNNTSTFDYSSAHHKIQRTYVFLCFFPMLSNLQFIPNT